MADFEIIISDSGTLSVALNTRFTYAESAIVGRTARGTLYSTSLAGFCVLLPTLLNDTATRAWFDQTLALRQALENRLGASALPALALGRHEVFACDVIVLATPLGSLMTTVQQLQKNQQTLAAEQLALHTALALLDVLSELSKSRQTLRVAALDWVYLPDEHGTSQPTMLPWDGYAAASDVVALNAMQDVGAWLYTLLTGSAARPPFSPFDDTGWQGRALAYQPQGILSVGLRYLLTALFHAPADQRFTDAGITFEGLRATISAWQTLTLTLGSVIDQQSPHSLTHYSSTLPRTYQFDADSPDAHAIWLDLWVRVHQSQDSGTAVLQPETARSDALLRSRVDHHHEARAQEAIQQALADPDLMSAIATLQACQSQVQALAETHDMTLWSLWQHLGRWQLLLGLPTPREVIRHIGSTLHRSPSEDSAPSLDILVNTLEELNLPTVMREVMLRQSALGYRQNDTWQSIPPRFVSDLATLPGYLQLPASVVDDLFALPYTVQGQMIGSLEAVRSRMVEALTVSNYEVVLALAEYSRTLPISVRQRDTLHETEQMGALAHYLTREVTLADIQEGMALLQQPVVQSQPLIRQPIEQKILTIAQHATERLNDALALKDWPRVRAALPAYHLLTQRDTRHLIEQLRVSHQQEARSVQQSAALNTYERLRAMYQTLFVMVSNTPTDAPRTPQEQQEHAQQVMTTLRDAIALGLPMDDIIASDDTSRQQWQQLITDSLGALQRMEHVTQDVEQLRQRLQGDGGLGAQLQTVNTALEALREQIEGGSNTTPSILTQIQGLRTQLSDVERSYMQAIEQSRREIRVTQDDIQRQLEAQDISLQRHSQQISSSGNLVQDARERLSLLEHQLTSAQQQEGQLLCSYLETMPDVERLERINAVLDAVDGLVYALRRCPAEAYSDSVHSAWMQQFEKLRERFDALTRRKLSMQERRTLKANLGSIRTLFSEVEQESRHKTAANVLIMARPADTRS